MCKHHRVHFISPSAFYYYNIAALNITGEVKTKKERERATEAQEEMITRVPEVKWQVVFGKTAVEWEAKIKVCSFFFKFKYSVTKL